jgi:hypothetical protein
LRFEIGCLLEGGMIMAVADIKEAALTFLKLVAGGQVDEAYAKYVAPGFRHHHPYFAETVMR